jgi:uncharacterized protein
MKATKVLRNVIVGAGLLASACAWGADSSPPVAPTAGPSAAAVAAAGNILGDVGIKQTIALIVPGMLSELERNVTNTRPEIKDSLRETLRAIQPEFDKSAQQMFDQASTLLASQMSEKEVQDVAAFFDTPSGKKYLSAEPVFLQQFAAIAEPWRQQLSTDILTRARDEMKKKGIDF